MAIVWVVIVDVGDGGAWLGGGNWEEGGALIRLPVAVYQQGEQVF